MNSLNIILHVYALTYNEERTLPFFLNHYSFADKIVLMDNYSTDNTLNIAKEYKNVVVYQFDTNKKFNDIIHRDIKNKIWKESNGIADYVIIQDLDEFLMFKEYPFNFKKGLQILKENNVLYQVPSGYEMCCSDEEFNNIPKNEQLINYITRGFYAKLYSKPCLFNPSVIIETNFSCGQHLWNPILNRNDNKVSPLNLLLLHYKHLGKEWELNRRIELSSRLSEYNINTGCGIEYRKDKNDTMKYIENFHKLSIDITNKMYNRKMTCVIWGGLGNQLFVIASTIATAKKNGIYVFFKRDNSIFGSHNPNGYWKDILKNIPYNNDIDTTQFTQVKENIDQNYEDIVIPEEGNIILNGYYQSSKYFKDYENDIRNIFTIEDKDANEYIKKLKTKSDFIVAIHIRRGDYTILGWNLPKSYYLEASNIILSQHPNAHFVVFSDDTEWCKQNFNWDVCENFNDYTQLNILSFFDSIIMSNSTFSWWGAFLGKENRKIIAPYPWLKNTKYNENIYYIGNNCNLIKLNY